MKNKIYILSISALLSIETSLANSVAPCSPPTASAVLDVNNVRALLMNGGDKFWDIFGTRNAGYEIPKASGKTSSFTAAIWISGVDAGSNLYTAGQTYRQTGIDFWPGTLNSMGEIESKDCQEADKMYSVYGSEIVNAKIGKGIAYNISRWPSTHAPFYDANNDGIYDPSLGDYPVLDVNNPSLIPGQMVFWTINDKGNIHTAYPNPNRLGIEIHNTAYAFESKSSDAINNTTIYRYKIINKSNNNYTQFRVAEFADYDLGDGNDDYIGCDLSTNAAGKKRNLFFAYNADNNDGDGNGYTYGISPPAFGMCFLNTGKNSSGVDLAVNSYMFFTNSGIPGVNSDPRNPIEFNRYINGFWADGQDLTYGTPTGRGGVDPYKFAFPGNTDPGGKPNWLETDAPGDRRVITAISDRTFAPGEQMTIEVAYVWARDLNGDNFTSLNKLRLSTDTLITAYSNNFSNFSTGLNEKKKQEFNVYPNPTTDIIYIEADFKINLIQIYNMQGSLLKEIKNTNTRKIDMDGLPEGTYILKVNNSSKRIMKL